MIDESLNRKQKIHKRTSTNYLSKLNAIIFNNVKVNPSLSNKPINHTSFYKKRTINKQQGNQPYPT